MNIRLDDRQRELVARMRVDPEKRLAVYTGTEKIPDWIALKKVMLALGSRWQRGSKREPGGFVFPEDVDAVEIVRLAQESGEILDPKRFGFFETPSPLAQRVADAAGLRPGDVVLEPSAGRGRLVRAAREAEPSVQVYCVELLPANAKALRTLGEATVEADFLQATPNDVFRNPAVRADVCLMNPPFAKNADIRHVSHVLGWDGGHSFLKPAYALVAIMSAGVVYRQDREHMEFRRRVSALRAEGVGSGYFADNPEGSFVESGTHVRTVTLVIQVDR